MCGGDCLGDTERYLAVSAECWKLGGGKEVYGDGRRKPILISATIGHDTSGNETPLQLSMPVWQCYTERLKQAGVGKN